MAHNSEAMLIFRPNPSLVEKQHTVYHGDEPGTSDDGDDIEL